jgi:hypothetical protein
LEVLTMQIRADAIPWPVSSKLVAILEDEIRKNAIPTAGRAVVIFRDPKWMPGSGGFHTVEIAVAADGAIQYVTDFGYFGTPPHVELGKEIDWEFSPPGFFQHFGREFPLLEGKELFFLWQGNFIQYVAMGVYTVKVSSFTGEEV